MIRINLLRPSYGAPAVVEKGGWVTRRELWGAIALLVAAAGLLYYLGSHSRGLMTLRRAPASPAGAPAPSADPPPAPSQQAKPAPSRPESSEPPAQPKPAQTKPAEPKGPVEAKEIVIERRPDALTIIVRASAGDLVHHSMKLEKPNRIVIDLQNCKLTAPAAQLTQSVTQPPITRVRASQFQTDPPVCRIVLDVNSFPRYEVIPGPEGLRIRVLDGNQ